MNMYNSTGFRSNNTLGGVPISPQVPPHTTLDFGISGTTHLRTLLVLKAWHCQDDQDWGLNYQQGETKEGP